MGRFYFGDIEGKFWFAVQSSNDGEFFGATECNTETVDYYVGDIDKVEKGIESCLTVLKDKKEQLDEFFKDRNMYNNKELASYLDASKEEVRDLLTWYARLQLGLKIQKCVEEHGSCSFTAEL